MHVGTLIDHRMRIHGVPIRWRKKISVWDPPLRFVDEQLRGPYRLWIHEHTFFGCGTRVTDQVRYGVPFDWLVHQMLVRSDVERIFRYRTDMLRQRFAVPNRTATTLQQKATLP